MTANKFKKLSNCNIAKRMIITTFNNTFVNNFLRKTGSSILNKPVALSDKHQGGQRVESSTSR